MCLFYGICPSVFPIVPLELLVAILLSGDLFGSVSLLRADWPDCGRIAKLAGGAPLDKLLNVSAASSSTSCGGRKGANARKAPHMATVCGRLELCGEPAKLLRSLSFVFNFLSLASATLSRRLILCTLIMSHSTSAEQLNFQGLKRATRRRRRSWRLSCRRAADAEVQAAGQKQQHPPLKLQFAWRRSRLIRMRIVSARLCARRKIDGRRRRVYPFRCDPIRPSWFRCVALPSGEGVAAAAADTNNIC